MSPRSLTASVVERLILLAPNFFGHFPAVMTPLLESGILLTSIVAVILNLFFNGWQSAEEARESATLAAAAAEA